MDDITEIKMEIEAQLAVETKNIPSDMESWKSQIQTTEEAIQWLNQGLGSFIKVIVEDCMQQMANLRKKVYSLGAPKSTNDLETRSISWTQQIGAKRGETLDISQELIIGSPNKSTSHAKIGKTIERC